MITNRSRLNIELIALKIVLVGFAKFYLHSTMTTIAQYRCDVIFLEIKFNTYKTNSNYGTAGH